MKTYLDYGHMLKIGNTSIPKDPANTDYARALAEVAANPPLAEIISYVPPPVTSWPVPKLTVVERLIAAGKLAKADAALGQATLAIRKRYEAAEVIMSDNADAIALLTAIGADPAVILAKM